jgi:hypothetical protein
MNVFYKKVIVGFGLLAISATVAEATPAFARQMDANCMACHYQNIPKLNSFGRDFKLSGFTMVGSKVIQGSSNGGLSLPSILNMGFITKARLHKSGDDDIKTEIFDESAFIFGGKIADGVGTSMEFGAGLLGGKIAFTKGTSVGRIGLTYYMTDALGAFSGTEVYSTGLYRPVRQFENRKKANIFQNLGIGDGEATGIQAYYSGNGFIATIGQYIPAFANSAVTGSEYKTLARVSYNMNLSGLALAVGGYYIGGDVSKLVAMNVGNSKLNGININALDLKSTGLDLQLEGDVANMPMMVTAGYVLSNTHGTVDITGGSIAAQLNPMDFIGVKAAVLSTTDNSTSGNSGETTFSVGTDYMYAQNIRLCLEVSNTSYEDDLKDSVIDTIFMSMIAF